MSGRRLPGDGVSEASYTYRVEESYLSANLPTLHSDPALRCELVPERDAVRIVPVGSLDMATAPVVDEQLAELRAAGFRALILDLGRLDFMDSSGLRLILRWDAAARSDGFKLTVAPGNSTVMRVFQVTGTTDRIPFADAIERPIVAMQRPLVVSHTRVRSVGEVRSENRPRVS